MEIEIILKILLAAMLGGIIGLERELSHKEAGLRTNVLIAIGIAVGSGFYLTAFLVAIFVVIVLTVL
jgi:uncharacterized membrane protein YhiD involved in acid resistance